MMKLKLGELSALIEPLNYLSKQPTSAVFAYRISKICRTINEELKDYDKLREDLCKKYCENDEEGNPIIKDGNQYKIIDFESFNKEWSDLNAQEVDVNISKINLQSFVDEGVKITPSQAYTLEPIIYTED